MHLRTKVSQHSPFTIPKPIFDQTQQFTSLTDSSSPLDSPSIKHVKQTIGVLLYHTGALNSTLFAVLNTLGTEQASATGNTIIDLTQLLDYCTIYPNPTLRFVASDMVLRIYSDASYLSVSKARSRAVGFFFCPPTVISHPLMMLSMSCVSF